MQFPSGCYDLNGSPSNNPITLYNLYHTQPHFLWCILSIAPSLALTVILPFLKKMEWVLHITTTEYSSSRWHFKQSHFFLKRKILQYCPTVVTLFAEVEGSWVPLLCMLSWFLAFLFNYTKFNCLVLLFFFYFLLHFKLPRVISEMGGI